MAALNPPGFLQNAGATHTAEQMRNWLSLAFAGNVSGTSLIAQGGVHGALGNKLSVTQAGSPNMTVIVKSGGAMIPGTEGSKQAMYAVLNDADNTVNIAAADPTLPRIDIIVYKVQDQAYSGGTNTSSIVAVTGTPAASPSPPAAPANSITLAQVAVAANATSIVNANITDKRTYLNGVSKLPDVQKFTAGGTWTMPTGARWVHIKCVGDGGGGGSTAATGASEAAESSGGGGGGYAEAWFDASALTSTVAVTIGTGGAGGAATGSNSGSAGTGSSFGAFLTSNGGGGGAGGTNTTTNAIAGSGTGGTASVTGGISSIAITGDDGGNGRVISAGPVYANYGGAGPLSSLRRAGASGTTAGSGGRIYGGGGTGARAGASQSSQAGGAGAAGLVLVDTYFG